MSLRQASFSKSRFLSSLVAAALIGGVGLLPSALFFTSPVSVEAATSAATTLQQQKTALDQKAKQAQAAAAAQAALASRAATRIQQAASQITQIQQSIQTTTQSINATQTQIDQQNQAIADQQSAERKLADQRDALLRRMYEMRESTSDSMQLFSNEPISDQDEAEQAFTTLKDAVTASYDLDAAAENQIEQARDALVKKQNNLQDYNSQQTVQQQGLADVQQQQTALKQNALQAETTYEQQASNALAQENKVESQIESELSTVFSSKSFSKIAGGSDAGNPVSRGTLVGHEGSTGNSTGPHVHFECRVNNVPVSCIPYVNSGELVYPVSGFTVTQKFGEVVNSYLYHGAPHSGTDLSAAYGTPVYAPANGTVILNKYYGDYGNAWAEQLSDGLVVLLGHMTGN